MPYKVEYPPPPSHLHIHALSKVLLGGGGQVPYFDPGFNAVYLKKCIDMHSVLRSLQMGPDWHW